MNTTDPEPQAERPAVPPSLKRFVWDIQSMVELAESEREILLIGRDLMTSLVANDDWLPDVFAAAKPGEARQFQLYSDGLERFAVVSTVLWGGAALSIDQESVWEIMGVLRGAVTRDNRSKGRLLEPGSAEARASGGAGSRLSNALDDRISICIHVYGGEIGPSSRRSVTPDGRMAEEPSGYANAENAPPYDIFSIQTEIRD